MTPIHGFELIREQLIAEVNTHARLFRHIKTGAELLSLENDDENKSFGITFRTPPRDSTGIAHILEHSVLCGSRKYPLKEPFVELLKGSVKTFLNAITFPDKTAYPVASTNLQDFYNLVDVYLDAVFYPRITPEILQQEGWHYELNGPDDTMIFKGVVFNEMKGAYSSPDSLLYRASQQSLFPDTIYGVDSGGDPKHIPDLTYEQFKQFHQTLYHPSNARIFFSGDDPPEERLRLINAYLQDFERIEPHSVIPLQPPFSEPKHVVHTYAVTADQGLSKKAMVTVNWMLGELRDPQLSMALGILSYILIGTPAAPLRKTLIDSGLGEDLAGGGMSGRIRQSYFSIGLKGIAEEDAANVETLIVQTLADLAHKGIDADTIAAALNTVEFSLRENNTGSFPRGLSLMFRALGTWLYDEDPLTPLAFEAPLAAIKAEVARGGYFERLIADSFLENTHRSTVILRPDPEQTQRDEAAERARLDATRAAMGPEEIQEVITQTQLLKQMQETPDPPEALASIPSLTLADLERQVKTIPIEEDRHAGATLLYHDLFTSGIVYFDLALNMHTVPADLLPYLPLFGRALVEMGTEKEDFVKLSQRIGRSTGGIFPSMITATITPDAPCTAWFLLRGKAVAGQAPELLAIMRDVLLTVRLDNRERFRQIVLKKKAGMEAGLVPSGNSVVSTRLMARFNEADWADEVMGGINYLFFLRDLISAIDNDWPGVLAKLEAVRHLLVNRSAMLCNVTLDHANWTTFRPQLHDFLGQFPAAPLTTVPWTITAADNGFEGLTIPAQVNYVGKGANLYELGYNYHASAAVITKHLRTSWLWDKVRVQGGAYGGGCSFNRRSGVFTFVSYRDPNLLGTLDVYDQAGQFLRQAELSKQELTRGIIGVIGDLDAYQLPDAKGYTSMVRYMVGESDEQRQQVRDQVFATSLADFKRFADVLDGVREQGQIVVMGSQKAIEAANAARPGLLKLVKVL